MKKAFMMVMLLLISGYANAENIPLTFTDRLYSDGIWYPGAASTISPNNHEGLAWRFVLNDAWAVSSISGFMTGVDLNRNTPPSPGWAKFYLYQGSSLNTSQNFLKPPSQFFYESDSMIVPLDNTKNEYKQSVNLELPSGDYWFRANGGASDGIINVNDFKMTGTVTTPEPDSFLLLGGGLLAGWRMRKRNGQG